MCNGSKMPFERKEICYPQAICIMPPTITWDLERWKSRPIGPVTASDLLNAVGCAIYPLTEPGSPLFSDERMHHDAVVKTFVIYYWMGKRCWFVPSENNSETVNYSRTRVNLWRLAKAAV